MQKKDIALLPLYLYQGRKLKRTTLRLPEAIGERKGSLQLTEINANDDGLLKSLNLMVVGDSSAAGVGAVSQDDALIGNLLTQLKSNTTIQNYVDRIDWALHATSGHKSFDVLKRLYALQTPNLPVDFMIIMVGVNDTTANIPYQRWQAHLRELIHVSKRKFKTKHILFTCLPNMQKMPAIPRPLNKFMGSKTQLMNLKLIEVCQDYDNVSALQINFADKDFSIDQLFAEDGFHPTSTAYSIIAKAITDSMVKTLSEE